MSDPNTTSNGGFNYTVPKKPFYKKPIGVIAIVVGVFIVIGIIASAAGGGGSDSSPQAAPPASHSSKPSPTKASPTAKPSPTKPAKPAKPAGTLPLTDGDWKLVQIQTKDDGLGDFGGTARVVYTGSDTSGGSGLFTITVLNGKKVVATLNGSADGVKPKDTATVQLISSDSYKSGHWTYDFSKDL